MSAFIGIDVGQTGCISLIDDGHLIFWDHKKHDPIETLYSIKATYGSCFTVVEKQHARPMQGVTSTAKVFYEFGRIVGALEVLKFPFIIIRPQEWQKGLGLPPSKKKKEHKQAIAKHASRLFPDADFHGPKGGLLDGRSDSAMIADYARRRYTSKA